MIDCMPVHTRAAMLDGVRANRIIAGAYSDRDGGICPMVAAHRCGGRTDYRAFARAWDRFTGTLTRRGKSRRATRRELTILLSHLEASLLAEEQIVDLAQAIDEHRALRGRTRPSACPARARPGDADRSAELTARGGWSWLRPFRRLDDYERALAAIDGGEAAGAAARELEPVA
ncbi:MAG: hypothetical protein NVSMB51_02970 [Solirubrobacteraceae bacterium]